MPYNTIETSTQSGEPVELYEFTHGTTVYRYTSSQTDVTFSGFTYGARAMSRGSIEANQEVARAALSVTVERTLPLLALFKFMPPSEVIAAKVMRYHRGDAEAVTIWLGRILNVAWQGLQAVIRCESVYSSIKRPGLRRLYQTQCPHVLYSPQCGVVKATRKVTKTVASISGLAITFNDFAGIGDQFFAGGYIEWVAGGITERRSVRQQIGAVVTVNYTPQGLAVATSVDLYPGCDHTLATCQSKYSNGPNYGGFPYIPAKNPFGGSPIY